MPVDENKHTVFSKEFTLQEPIPDEGIERAVELMKNGRLHRYNIAAGETSETSIFEKEIAEYFGKRYCAAFSSCGSSLYIALKCLGVKPGDTVLCNAFTLAPVPSAVENAGAHTLMVDINEDYTLDVEDLEKKAAASKAEYLMLSHMRGHISDMDRVVDICQKYNLKVVEDCAHTMGAKWGDRYSGTFFDIGCFSTQTYKHMNSGEGGLLITDDEDIAAKAVLYSGSYMLYETHLARPPLEVFEKYKKLIPNYSLRMSNLQAALLRPQLKNLAGNCGRWNERYRILESELKNTQHLFIPERPEKEKYAASSFQFSLPDFSTDKAEKFVEECALRGVEIKWFGRSEPKGFTATFESWKFLSLKHDLVKAGKILSTLCDFRIPLTFSLDDCRIVAAVIRESLEATVNNP